MDRTRFRYLLILTACIIVCCLFLSACSSTRRETEKKDDAVETVTVDKQYTVTVCNGIRHVTAGSYKEGASFTVTAENITDKMFIGWQYEGVMATDLAT